MRRYGNPIEVRRTDDRPSQFLWRDRLYVVRAVLAHWVEAGRWWRAGGEGLDDREREFWRVEAAAGKGSGLGVYDLCFDWSRGAWFLATALD